MKMDFLTLEEIKKQLTEVDIQLSSLILSENEIDSIKNHIDLNPPEELRKGNCLLNAYRVAENANAEIVEGIAYVTVENDVMQSETIIKHAWNSFNGNYFDITRDFVWANLSVKLIHIEYYFLGNFPLKTYKIDGNILEFKSNADLIASSLRYINTKKNVLIILNSLGLEKKYHEKLLKECIDEVKNKSHE